MTTGYASDVICVDGPEGLYSTDFFVKFSLPKFNEQILDQYIINLSNDLISNQLVNQSIGQQTNQITNHQSIEQVNLLDIEPDYIDIYSNGQLCQNIEAIVGYNEQLYFIQLNDSNSYNISLTPNQTTLKAMNLNKDKNEIKCIHRKSYQIASFDLWLYDYTDSLIIVDIDGTITISDVRGYIETVYLGIYSYIHSGIISFMNYLVNNYNYKLIYLSARPISHKKETRKLLTKAIEKSETDTSIQSNLPEGCLLVNRAFVVEATYSEVIAKTTKQQKISELLKVVDVFKAAGRDTASNNPFKLGLGNKQADALAYYSIGVPPDRILLIDTSSTIRVWKLNSRIGQSSALSYLIAPVTICFAPTLDIDTFYGYKDPMLFEYINEFIYQNKSTLNESNSIDTIEEFESLAIVTNIDNNIDKHK